MQLKQLHMQFFGPYADAVVDFDDFRTSPLFLISGPTGSGKTTIFDALIYALYGETSGERDGGQMRSNFAGNSDLTKVTLTFDHDGKHYLIERQPPQLQSKKRGDGLTEVKAKVLLAISSDEKQVAEYRKKNQVQEQLDAVLHLDASQFRQIVLLPQGDFRRFLDADSNAKEDLLRDLFGTQLIQRWQTAMLAQMKAKGAVIQDQERMLDVLMSQFDFETAPDEHATMADKLSLMRATVASQAKVVTARQATAAQSHQRYQEAQTALQQGQQLAQAFTEREQAATALAKLAEQKQTHQKQLKQIEQLTWVQQHENAAQRVQKAGQDLKAAIVQSEQTQAALTTTKQKFSLDKQALARLQAKSDQIEAQKKQLNSLQAVQQQLTAIAEQNKQVIKQAAIVNEAELALTHAQQQLTDAQTVKTQQQTSLDNLGLDELITTVNTQRNLLAALVPQAANYQEAQADVAQLSMAIKKTQVTLEQAETQVAATTSHLNKLQQTQIRQQIAHLAAKLEPDSPCPVCGSTSHPHPALVVDEPLVSEAALKQADQERQKAAARKTMVETQLANLETQLKTAKAKTAQARQAFTEHWQEQAKLIAGVADKTGILQQLTALKTLAATNEHQLTEAQTKHAALQVALKKSDKAITTGTTKVQQCEASLNTARIDAAEAQSALKTMQKNLPAEATDLATVAAQATTLQTTITTYQAQLQEAQARVNALDRQLAGLQADEKHAAAQVTALTKEQAEAKATFTIAVTQYFGADGKQRFAELQLRVSQLPLLNEQVQTYEHTQLKQQTLLDAANKTIGTQAQPQLDQLEAEATASETTATNDQTALIKISQAHDAAEKLVKQAATIFTANQTALAAYADLQTLATVMNGNGPKKLSLERYVLQAYLQEILNVANSRLQVLSNNRYQFVLHTSLGTQKIHSGLEIDVYDDQVGEKRAVQTLSGGESFIAALSLALALGEVIQQESGGINIDALFVDEGFGSLDANSLDVAMNALESLEGESRLIGIISHVTELRDNIPDQLQVEPAGTGRSRLKILHSA